MDGQRISSVTEKVSIPFKRESVSKGRGYRSPVVVMQVSIPFKRESVSKDDTKRIGQHTDTGKFQFPSNGKAYPKFCFGFTGLTRFLVSIPFKRESVSKAHRDVVLVTIDWFQFPSNGKAYPKHLYIGVSTMSNKVFQFPSNGKAYPKLS